MNCTFADGLLISCRPKLSHISFLNRHLLQRLIQNKEVVDSGTSLLLHKSPNRKLHRSQTNNPRKTPFFVFSPKFKKWVIVKEREVQNPKPQQLKIPISPPWISNTPTPPPQTTPFQFRRTKPPLTPVAPSPVAVDEAGPERPRSST